MADAIHSWLLLAGLLLGGAAAATGLAAAAIAVGGDRRREGPSVPSVDPQRGVRAMARVATRAGAAGLAGTVASLAVHRLGGHAPGSDVPRALGRLLLEHPAYWVAALLGAGGLAVAALARRRMGHAGAREHGEEQK